MHQKRATLGRNMPKLNGASTQGDYLKVPTDPLLCKKKWGVTQRGLGGEKKEGQSRHLDLLKEAVDCIRNPGAGNEGEKKDG